MYTIEEGKFDRNYIIFPEYSGYECINKSDYFSSVTRAVMMIAAVEEYQSMLILHPHIVKSWYDISGGYVIFNSTVTSVT